VLGLEAGLITICYCIVGYAAIAAATSDQAAAELLGQTWRGRTMKREDDGRARRNRGAIKEILIVSEFVQE
jgi:hypothetical protein